MPQSFTAADGPLADAGGARRRRVLVTGAAGNIGSYFARASHRKYRLRLMVRPGKAADSRRLGRFGEVVEGDITDLDSMKRLCRGIDTVVHLAADPSPEATWDSLLSANILGTYHTFVAARYCRCRRVIYASSIHAVSGYPPDVQVKTSEPVNPGDLYGVSKCFGEALARYMAEKEGLSSLVIRIGAFQPMKAARRQDSVEMVDAWISQRDLNQLIEKCIDVVELKFAILNGVSDNRFKRLDISDARQLVGYRPQDDLTQVNPAIKRLKLRQRVHAHSLADADVKSGLRQDLKPRHAGRRRRSGV